jgi:hypothetical protein
MELKALWHPFVVPPNWDGCLKNLNAMKHCLTPLITRPNWWSNKWTKDTSWNCMHKVILIGQYKASPTTICRMFLKGIAKAKILTTPKTLTMDLRIWLVVMWKHNYKSCRKLLVKSSRSYRFHKCSKTILKRTTNRKMQWPNEG